MPVAARLDELVERVSIGDAGVRGVVGRGIPSNHSYYFAMGEAECADLESSGASADRRRVGVPVQEGLLTAAFLNRIYGAKRPGLGRSTYVLLEPGLGAGRPDVVLLTISPSALEWFRRSELRLPSPLAARAADPTSDVMSLGVSKSHAIAVRRDLERRGWLDADFTRISGIISESVAIEAKMRDWKSAIRQVAKFRGLFTQSAILMPQRPLPEAAFTALNYYDCGLLFRDDERFFWERQTTFRDTPAWTRVWLLELLLRGLEAGTGYKSVSPRKSVSASR